MAEPAQDAERVRVRDALNGILAALQVFLPVVWEAGLDYDDVNRTLSPYGYLLRPTPHPIDYDDCPCISFGDHVEIMQAAVRQSDGSVDDEEALGQESVRLRHDGEV